LLIYYRPVIPGLVPFGRPGFRARPGHPGPVRRPPTPYRSPNGTRMGWVSPRPRQAWGRSVPPSPGATPHAGAGPGPDA